MNDADAKFTCPFIEKLNSFKLKGQTLRQLTVFLRYRQYDKTC